MFYVDVETATPSAVQQFLIHFQSHSQNRCVFSKILFIFINLFLTCINVKKIVCMLYNGVKFPKYKQWLLAILISI